MLYLLTADAWQTELLLFVSRGSNVNRASAAIATET